MVKDPQKLRKNYFNSKYVIFDVLSILPTGYSLSEALILALITKNMTTDWLLNYELLQENYNFSKSLISRNCKPN